MAEHDFLDSILNDLWDGSSATSKEPSGQFNTDDFQLDDILKEFGITPEPPRAAQPAHSSFGDDILAPRSHHKAAHAEPKPKAEPEKAVLPASPAPTAPAESKPAPVIAQEPPKPTTPKKPAGTTEREQHREPLIHTDEGKEFVKNLFAGAASATPEKIEQAEEAEVHNPVRPIKRILDEREEENYKMRSGYIDLNAIRAATAARDPHPADANQAQLHKYVGMNTEQRNLMGKIGDFFRSDATFQFDTSSVNDLEKSAAKTKRQSSAPNKVNDDDFKIAENVPDIYEKDDIPRVDRELLYQVNIAGIKTVVSAILTLPLLLLNLFPSLIQAIFPSLSLQNPINHAIANLFFLGIVALLNYNIIGKGVAGFFRLRPTGSTPAAIAMLACIAQTVSVLITGVAPQNLYCTIASASVVGVLFGKYLYYKNVYKNFEILAFDTPKTACINVAGGYSLKELYNDKEKISACRDVDLITRFLSNSFDYNFADRTSRVSILAAILLAAVGVLAGFLLHRSESVVTLIAVAACAITPLCYDFAYACPMLTISNKIRKNGSAVVSYTRASEFAKTSTMVLADSDLFKPEQIIVHSMKINGNDRINDVIINCASLLHESGSPVAGAFMNILDNKAEMLLPVYNFDWIPEKGFSGYINNVKYFVGNSRYLADCGIKLPTIDLEEKYKRSGRQVIMFADSSKLLAVFSISYCRDELIFRNLHKINLGDLNLLILTRDSNITPELMSEIYEMPASNFTIASKSEFERLYFKGSTKPKHPAGIYSITGASGITSALARCRRMIGMLRASVAIRTLAISCGALLFLLFSILSPNIAATFQPGQMALFHLLWFIPTLFVSLFAG